jgi:hypothetical protein
MCIMYMMPGPSSDGEFNTRLELGEGTKMRGGMSGLRLTGLRSFCVDRGGALGG